MSVTPMECPVLFGSDDELWQSKQNKLMQALACVQKNHALYVERCPHFRGVL